MLENNSQKITYIYKLKQKKAKNVKNRLYNTPWKLKTLQHTIGHSIMFLEQPRPNFLLRSRPPATEKTLATMFQWYYASCDML